MNKQRKVKKEIEYLHWKRQGKIASSDFIGVYFTHRHLGMGQVVAYSSDHQRASIALFDHGDDTVIHQTLFELLGKDSKWRVDWKSMNRIAPETKTFWIGPAEQDAPSR